MKTERPIRTLSHCLFVTVAAMVGVAGCASAPIPSQEMAVAEASVLRASNPMTRTDAAAELQVAIGKLAAARRALDGKAYEQARRLAEQADVDAQVAESHAMSVRARVAAQESQDAARALREEISRKSSQ